MDKLFDDRLAPEQRFVTLAELPAIDDLNCQRPDAGFVASVAAHQIQPIVMIDHPFDGLKLVVGNRRVYAAHLASLPGLWAWVYKTGDINPAMIQVAENHHRKPNPFSDLDAIIPMLGSRTINEVAAELKLPVGVVRAAIRLADLDKGLLELARDGLIATGVAVDLARRPKSVQETVLRNHKSGQRVTAAAVKEAATAEAQAIMPTLPIRDLQGGPGLQFGRALDTAKGVRLIFWEDGGRQEFVIPVEKLHRMVSQKELA